MDRNEREKKYQEKSSELQEKLICMALEIEKLNH